MYQQRRAFGGYNDAMTTLNPQTTPQPDALQPHRFSTEQYLRMIEIGVLGPEHKVELIHGIISDMTPAGTRHHHTLMRLTRLFAPLLEPFELGVQTTTVIAGGQVFDPDFMLLERKSYKHAHPEAGDIRLIIEAADSSLNRDLKVKLPIYAAAGIADYWVADCDREVLHVHRQPTATGYTEAQELAGDQTVAPLAAPEHAVRVADLFG